MFSDLNIKIGTLATINMYNLSTFFIFFRGVWLTKGWELLLYRPKVNLHTVLCFVLATAKKKRTQEDENMMITLQVKFY